MVETFDRILEDLRREVHKYALMTSQQDLTQREPAVLTRVRQTQRVNSHLPIGWPVMPKALWRKVICYLQKITRRLLRWYINPLVDQQNAFNSAVTDALEEQYHTIVSIEARLTHLEEGIDALQRQLERLEKTLAAQPRK